MKALKIVWKILIGGAVTAGGWMAVAPQLEAEALTGAAVLGIGLIAVGVSVLAGAFE